MCSFTYRGVSIGGQNVPERLGSLNHVDIYYFFLRYLNQSILKEISLEYSLKGLILKLKDQNFGHLMQRTDLFEKTLILEKIDGEGRRG